MGSCSITIRVVVECLGSCGINSNLCTQNICAHFHNFGCRGIVRHTRRASLLKYAQNEFLSLTVLTCCHSKRPNLCKSFVRTFLKQQIGANDANCF